MMYFIVSLRKSNVGYDNTLTGFVLAPRNLRTHFGKLEMKVPHYFSNHPNFSNPQKRSEVYPSFHKTIPYFSLHFKCLFRPQLSHSHTSAICSLSRDVLSVPTEMSLKMATLNKDVSKRLGNLLVFQLELFIVHILDLRPVHYRLGNLLVFQLD